MRLQLDLDSELPAAERLQNFTIHIAPQPSQFLILNGNQTLQQVNEKFWKVNNFDKNYLSFPYLLKVIIFILKQVNKPMEMYYAWKKS